MTFSNSVLYTLKTSDDETLPILHQVCLTGNLQSVKALLEKSATNIQEQDYVTGHSALHVASEHGHLDIVQYLLEQEANIEARDCKGATALHIASAHNHLTLVKALLKQGADVNATTNIGLTPLYEACEKGHLTIVKYLLEEKKASILFGSAQGVLLDIACSNGHLELVKYLLTKDDAVKELKMFNLDEIDLLHLACEAGCLSVVEFLLGKGITLEAKNSAGQTSLYIACDNHHIDIADFLLKKAADAFCSDNLWQYSLLHLAVLHNNIKLVWLLLNQKERADLLLKTTYIGYTPIDTVSFFLENIAKANRAPATDIEKKQLAICVLLEIAKERYFASYHHESLPDSNMGDFDAAFYEQKKQFVIFLNNRDKQDPDCTEALYSSKEPMLDRIGYINFSLLKKLRAMRIKCLKVVPQELFTKIVSYYLEEESNNPESYTSGFQKHILPYLPHEKVSFFNKGFVASQILKTYENYIYKNCPESSNYLSIQKR